jgi:hypothetical protein
VVARFGDVNRGSFTSQSHREGGGCIVGSHDGRYVSLICGRKARESEEIG